MGELEQSGHTKSGNIANSTRIQYGILDLLVKVLWMFSFLFAVEAIDYEVFGFVRGLFFLP